MKKALSFLLLLALCCAFSFARAESETTVRFKRFETAVDAEEIDLGKVGVAADEYEAFYDFLRRLPNLKRVDMYKTKIRRNRIEELAELFPDIEFGWTMMVGDHEVRTDISAFSTAHSDASRRHTNEDFSVLKYCKNLQALDIGHNAVTDLSFLQDLPNLKVLIVVDNQFQDITPIASLSQLEYLEIFFNDVRDISCLPALTRLMDLNICFNRITDIRPLHQMTWLKRLWVSQYNSHNPSIKPDPAEVEALVAALPDTQVDSTAKSSIGNHWRDHSHYKTLKKMFKTQSYLPFDDSPDAP